MSSEFLISFLRRKLARILLSRKEEGDIEIYNSEYEASTGRPVCHRQEICRKTRFVIPIRPSNLECETCYPAKLHTAKTGSGT